MTPEKQSWSVAFSYIRFSILVQSKGDSLRRQTKLSASDRANRNATVAASKNSPMSRAPATATVMSRFMSGRRRSSARHAFGATYQAPVTTAPM